MSSIESGNGFFKTKKPSIKKATLQWIECVKLIECFIKTFEHWMLCIVNGINIIINYFECSIDDDRANETQSKCLIPCQRCRSVSQQCQQCQYSQYWLHKPNTNTLIIFDSQSLIHSWPNGAKLTIIRIGDHANTWSIMSVISEKTFSLSGLFTKLLFSYLIHFNDLMWEILN